MAASTVRVVKVTTITDRSSRIIVCERTNFSKGCQSKVAAKGESTGRLILVQKGVISWDLRRAH